MMSISLLAVTAVTMKGCEGVFILLDQSGSKLIYEENVLTFYL